MPRPPGKRTEIRRLTSCDQCGARQGELCKTKDGKHTRNVIHGARLRKYRQLKER